MSNPYDGMGAIPEQPRQFEYYQIVTGKICRTEKKPTAGYAETKIEKKDKSIKTLWCDFKDGLYGYIHNIELHKFDDGVTKFFSWRIHFDIGASYYLVLSLAANSREASRLLNTAPNIDYSKPVYVRTWHDTKEQRTAIVFKQDDVSVPQAYTRENPNGRPEPEKDPMDGTSVSYDNVKRWLHANLKEHVIPEIQHQNYLRQQRIEATVVLGAQPEHVGDVSDDEVVPPAQENGGGDDDIPF